MASDFTASTRYNIVHSVEGLTGKSDFRSYLPLEAEIQKSLWGGKLYGCELDSAKFSAKSDNDFGL